MSQRLGQFPRITVRNLQRKRAVNVKDLQQFAEHAAAACLNLPGKTKTDLAKLSEVSILIISDKRMASLHRRFMNEAGPTDVITFQHGEIFISADTAQGNAKRFGNSLPSELRLYIVHGLLHLHGFKDRDPKGALKMRAAEKKVLSKVAKLVVS
jgi:probable rRNA maturation factor